MKRIVVDPVTRIEGHLRLETVVDEASGQVSDAVSSGTMWRGIEVILRGRDPRDAWAFAQRICGVCTTVHALASLRSVEDALQIEIPKNANYMRNIMAASQMVHDHLVHFYYLHALDCISPVEALKADPAATAALQNTLLAKYSLTVQAPVAFDHEAYPKEFPKATTAYYQAVQSKVKGIVESGQLGIFAANWWDHPDYGMLPPEVHLLAVGHYLNLLDRQRELVTPHVIFGGKNPHPHYIVGGMPAAISLSDMNAPINTERLAVVESALNLAAALTNYFYLPDVLAIGAIYLTQHNYFDGGGLAGKRVLGYGDYPDESYSGIQNGDYHSKLLVRSNGVVENFAGGVGQAVFTNLAGQDFMNQDILQEAVDHSWYNYPAAGGRHPLAGVTEPKFTGPKEGTKTNWQSLDENGKYSWLKTPLWQGKTVEVGPLARYIIVYTKVKQGHMQPTWAEAAMVSQVDQVSQLLNMPPEKWLPSTVGRTLARCLETQLAVYQNKYFFDKLVANIKAGDTAVANSRKWEPSSWPKEAQGVGLVEAPRGALGHWCVIKDGKLANYQAIVPSTWNACPRTQDGQHGAYEASMIDTRVKVPEKPVEILRTVHSFDPCLACATHLYDKDGRQLSVAATDARCQL